MRILLWLIRHGETDANKNKIIQGQQDCGLNETGINQAKDLGLVLQPIKFHHVFSSDLGRAMQTVNLCTANMDPQPNIQRCPDARERNYGEFEGKDITERMAIVSSAGCKLREYLPKGAETVEELQKRVIRALHHIFTELTIKDVINKRENAAKPSDLEIMKKDDDLESENGKICNEDAGSNIDVPKVNKLCNVLLLTHSGFIRATLIYLLSIHAISLTDTDRERLNRSSPNTSITLIDINWNQLGDINYAKCLKFFANANSILS